MRVDTDVPSSAGVREPGIVRAFSEEDIAFLTPSVTDGLSQAAPNQQISFAIKQTGALHQSPIEQTTGFLYAYGRSLYLTLTQYKGGSLQPGNGGMGNPNVRDGKGAVNDQVLFFPESAKRADTYRDSRSTNSTLVIDYELLARLPHDLGPAALNSTPSTVAPTKSPATTATDPSAAKGERGQKDPELEALRKELEEIKKQLAEQAAQRNATQPRIPATPKSPDR
ncbi:hypothetical protein W02_39080 [Nitrospira sp. KM1]|uniref:hypothetical protein n=1 Tax=Nitrospira sp. KM1 TaxID=1936990 RepID=UPI0013A74D8D|nr:hypothetical protein [Nitrospira sp. KM1]BCA56768.1 hypothetical protein W02_39080 [Nitrospira sp. KM1]